MPIADFVIKSGDTAPVLTDTLTYSDGSAVNLTGATLTFAMRSLQGTAPVNLTGAATITGTTTGQVQFTFTAADTAHPGNYMANWVVTLAGGSVMTFPTVGYIEITIEASLSTIAQTLVSLPDVKEYLNIKANDRSEDAKLLRFIDAVTPVIENIVGPVVVREFDEWHDGGQYWIRLRHRPSFAIGSNPVLTLMACEEYRGPVKYTLSLIDSPDKASLYSVMLDARMGTVYRRTTGGGVIPFAAGPWGGGMPDAVHVVYQAGHSPVPENIAEAAREAIRINYRKTQATGRGVQSPADGEDMGRPLGFFFPRSCLELLAPMRRHPAIA